MQSVFEQGGSITSLFTNDGADSITVTVTDDLASPSHAGLEAGKRRLEIFAQSGADTIDASLASLGIAVDGGSGKDTITGGSGDDIVYGGAGDDIILLGDGSDIGLGGGGADFIDGQGGNDVIFGDIAKLLFQDDGTITLQSTLPTVGGNDTIVGGSGTDFLVGGKGRDLFFGSLSEDVIFGNTARIRYNPDYSLIEFASDPSNREIISDTLFRLYTNDYRSADSQYDPEEFSSAYDDPLNTPLRTDIALRLTPLLDPAEMLKMSNAELQDFLRSLPLTQADNPVGYQVAPLLDAGGGADGIPPRPSDGKQLQHRLEEVVLQDNDNLQPVAPAAENSVDSSDESHTLQDSLAASVAASMLLAARVSRKRGWHIGWVGDAGERIQGDLGELRKLQSERQFKIWRKH